MGSRERIGKDWKGTTLTWGLGPGANRSNDSNISHTNRRVHDSKQAKMAGMSVARAMCMCPTNVLRSTLMELVEEYSNWHS